MRLPGGHVVDVVTARAERYPAPGALPEVWPGTLEDDQNRRDFTIESLNRAAYDPYLTAFAQLVPPLVRSWDATPASDPLKARVAEQVAMLRAWDYKWSASSVPCCCSGRRQRSTPAASSGGQVGPHWLA